MKIVCLVKQVPRADSIEFNPETKSLVREGIPLLLNRFDAFAIAEAVRLRERHGGEVIAMTMGPPQAEEALHACVALGADRCIHLSDRVFAVADTIGTSRTLALAIRREGADLVVCGRKALDAETWQVPPEVAAYLGWPQLTSAAGLEVADGVLRATQESDFGETVYEVALPAVCSVVRTSVPVPDDPLPTADGSVELWTARDLVPDLQPNDKRFGQPGSPTRVLAVRDARPERGGLVVSDAGEAADRVRERLAATAKPPSAWEKPERLGEKPGRSYDCWTVVELVGERPSRTSLELLGKGRELSGKLGGRNVALVVGHGLGSAVETVVRYGAEVVYTVDDATLSEYHTDTRVAALRQVVKHHRPHVLLMPATVQGRDYGPRLAGELELGMTGDCVDLAIDRAGRLIQHKPAYGGNIVSVIMGATTPQLATVRPRMFEPVEPRDGAEADVHHVTLSNPVPPRTRVAARLEGGDPGYELDEAAVVVCLGGGLESAEATDVAAHAKRVGAAIAGDRGACHAGHVGWNRHVGLLGRAVAPRLYLAVEATGDFEHLTGTVKADVIVALARDRSAPLLEAADIALAGDWRETLQPLLDALAGDL